jgi:hypothetical protein
MSIDFDSITEDTFSSQDEDKRILFKWAAVIAAVVVFTCLGTTSLLKVLGVIAASWLWVVAAAMISSIATGLVVSLAVVFLAAGFVSSIMSIG